MVSALLSIEAQDNADCSGGKAVSRQGLALVQQRANHRTGLLARGAGGGLCSLCLCPCMMPKCAQVRKELCHIPKTLKSIANLELGI